MKLGIGALVRGYKDIKNYDILISRNKAIKKVLIKKLKIPSEIILFHEGNIGSDHQKHIIDKSMIDIKFVDSQRNFYTTMIFKLHRLTLTDLKVAIG